MEGVVCYRGEITKWWRIIKYTRNNYSNEKSNNRNKSERECNITIARYDGYH